MSLLKTSTMMAKLANMDAAESTKVMTAVMNGFKMSASDMGGVLDKLVVLDNNYATSVKEIGTALSETANVSQLAGVSFEKMAAYITVVSHVTQQSAETIGNSFKTISARYMAVKAGKEFDDENQAINNVEKSLEGFGVHVRDSATHDFRPMSDVLDELSKSWNNYSVQQKNGIAGAFAGVRQFDRFITLMNNYDLVMKAVNEETNAAGTAVQRYGVYLNSIEAATNKLTTSWQKLAKNTGNSDMIKMFIDLSTVMLDLIDRIGIFNIGIVALTTFGIPRLLAVVPEIVGSIYKIIGAIEAFKAFNIVTVIASAQFVILGLTLVAAATYFNQVAHAGENAYDKFEKLRSQTDQNISELSDLSQQYESLSKKQNKTAEDTLALLDIQTILNVKYGASRDGVTAYTDAIDKNSTGIEKNIKWIQKQQEEQARSFLNQSKYNIQDAQKYLSSPVTGRNRITYANPEAYVAGLDKMIEKDGDLFGITRSIRDNVEAQIVAYQKIIIEAQHYQDLLKAEATTDTVKPLASHAVLAPEAEIQKQIFTLDELIKKAQDANTALASMGSEMATLIDSYDKFGELSIEQVNQLRSSFGEDYTKALTVEGDQVKLNVEALKELVIARAKDAVAAAEEALNTDKHNASLQESLAIAKAFLAQAESGELFAPSKEDTKAVYEKAYQNILKDTIDMLKQKAEAEKQGLQDQLDAYKAIIDNQKQVLDNMKEQLDYQDELNSKNKDLSKIENQLTALQFDDSQEAKAKKLKLEDEKAKKVTEITKFQRDNSIKIQKEGLDKEYADYKSQMDARIKAIDHYLKSTGALEREATMMLETNMKGTLAQLSNHMKQYGTDLEQFYKDRALMVAKAANDMAQSIKQASDDAARSMQQSFQAAMPMWQTNPSPSAQALMDTGAFSNEWFKGTADATQSTSSSSNINQYGGVNGIYGPPAPTKQTYGMTVPNDPASITNSSAWETYKNSANQYSNSGTSSYFDGDSSYLDAGFAGLHDSGGYVSGMPSIDTQHQFGVLMNDEFVMTPDMINTFMTKTLPQLAGATSSLNNNVTITIPMIVNGEPSKNAMDDLKDNVTKILTNVMKSQGYNRTANGWGI